MEKGSLLLLFWLLFVCCWQLVAGNDVAQKDLSQQPIKRIAFGSCNVHDKPQPIWQSVIETQPDLWMWLGDVVYADTKLFPFVWSPSPLKIMQEKYDAQKNRSEYKKLLNACPVIGVWDDHDYGKNNGGKEYFNKKESKRVYLEFLDEPRDSVRWQREGIYGSYVYGSAGKKVKVILLDTRYFKESELENDEETRDILGEEQWKWLREELTNSDAQIHLIGSGIQILPYDKPFQEKWYNFPASRRRLFETIRDTRSSGVILLSGDVHYAEIFRNNCTGVGYPLYEITSSGLTHSMNTHIPFGLDGFVLNGIMKSQLRVKNVYSGFNFGIVEIEWNEEEVSNTRIRLEIHDVKGNVVVEEVVTLSMLSPSRQYNESMIEVCKGGETAPKWTRWSLEMWLDYVKYVAVLLFLVIILLVAVVPLLSSFHNRKKQE